MLLTFSVVESRRDGTKVRIPNTDNVTLPSPDGPYITLSYTKRLNVTKSQANEKVCSENF